MTRSSVASFPPVGATTNPYQELLYDALAELGIGLADPTPLRSAWLWRSRGRVAYLHFHWLTSYYHHRRPVLAAVRLALLAQRLVLARALGYRIVWTVHEVYPHDRHGWADRVAPRIVARLAHALIVHDEATRKKARDALGRDAVVIPAGTFAGVYRPGRPRSAVREELGIPEDRTLILAFGLVRRYKRLEDVVDALRLIPPDAAPDFVVLVAGQVMDADVGDALERAALTDDRLRLRFGFVPDEHVADLLGAADALLVTRVDDGTSGVLTLGLSFGLPVIVADTPEYRAAAEVSTENRRFEPGDPASLAAALLAAASTSPNRSSDGRRPAEGLPAWSEVARDTAAVLVGTTRS